MTTHESLIAETMYATIRFEFGKMLKALKDTKQDQIFMMPNGEKRRYFLKNGHPRWIQED